MPKMNLSLRKKLACAKKLKAGLVSVGLADLNVPYAENPVEVESANVVEESVSGKMVVALNANGSSEIVGEAKIVAENDNDKGVWHYYRQRGMRHFPRNDEEVDLCWFQEGFDFLEWCAICDVVVAFTENRLHFILWDLWAKLCIGQYAMHVGSPCYDDMYKLWNKFQRKAR